MHISRCEKSVVYEGKNGALNKALKIVGNNGYYYTMDSYPTNYTVPLDECKVGIAVQCVS